MRGPFTSRTTFKDKSAILGRAISPLYVCGKIVFPLALSHTHNGHEEREHVDAKSAQSRTNIIRIRYVRTRVIVDDDDDDVVDENEDDSGSGGLVFSAGFREEASRRSWARRYITESTQASAHLRCFHGTPVRDRSAGERRARRQIRGRDDRKHTGAARSTRISERD